jgi:hypothetical protein
MLVHHVHFNDMNITDKLNDEMRVISGWDRYYILVGYNKTIRHGK